MPNTTNLLTGGAVLTKNGSIVNLELDGELSLFFISRDRFGRIDTDRADFLSREDRDAALVRTVGLYEADGWTRAEASE